VIAGRDALGACFNSQMALAEAADRAKIRRIERHNHHKIVPFAAGPVCPSTPDATKFFQSDI